VSPGLRSPSRVPPRFLIVGNPDNRRVVDFAAAVVARGLPPPLVLAHAALVAALSGDDPCSGPEPPDLFDLPGQPLLRRDEPLLVRIDAAGEDPALERALLRLGWAEARAHPLIETCSPEALAHLALRHGQILAPRQHHLGFERYLGALERALAARPAWRVLNPIADIRLLFDKRALSRHYAARGLPVAPSLSERITGPDAGADSGPGSGGPRCAESLREHMRARAWPAVYVKLSCASSASCLALYRHLPHQPPERRDLLVTTVVETEQGRFNSLRPPRLETRARIDPLLDWLLAQGCHIERALPKATVDGRKVDMRVLVVDGEAGFQVLRQSRHPFTNLHLGGQRGDLPRFRADMGEQAWTRAMHSCERAFAAHDCLHLGVDLLISPDLRGHTILEANAFGDLLPGLEREGKSVYAWEIEAALRLRP